MKLRTVAVTGAAVTATAVGGALATDPNSVYYRTLVKPSWQPPPPVYGLVWTPLYADIAVTSATALDGLAGPEQCAERRAYQVALGLNLMLNTAWSWLFFRSRRPWLAAAECAVLTASSADLVRRTAAVDRRAGLAMAPYPVWCAFATTLTVAIASRNPATTAAGNVFAHLRSRALRSIGR